MKILFATSSHFPAYGGPYFAIAELLENFLKKEINFRLIFAKNEFTKFNLNLEEIVMNFDIIHIYGLWQPFLIKVFFAARKKNKKIVFSPLGALEPWAYEQKKLKKKIAFHLYQKRILQKADFVLCTSYEEMENLKLLGINSKIDVIPHGVYLQNPKKFHIMKKKKKAIFFSRIHSKKGLLELVDAWQKINPENWTLDIYGPVSDENYLKKVEKMVIDYELTKKIKIFKPIFDKEKKLNLLMGSDCFILPSKSENFGISIAEALSCSLPVVTTFQTPWKIIQEKNAGIVFNFEGKRANENLIITLKNLFSLTDEQMKQMGENARKIIIEKFDHNLITEKYIKFYKTLVV